MPHDDVRRFLRYLFGDNTKATGMGIFVRRMGQSWVLTFKGQLAFNAEVVNGKVVTEVDPKNWTA
jgi:hypothetical protein